MDANDPDIQTMTWKIETSTDDAHWVTAVTGQAIRAP